MELKITAGQQTDGLALVAGFFSHVFGALGILLVVLVCAGGGVKRRALREVVALGCEETLVAVGGGQHFGFTNGNLNRLAHALVGHHAFLGVEHKVRKAVRGREDGHHAGTAFFNA